jgi:acyl-CoA thioesterase
MAGTWSDAYPAQKSETDVFTVSYPEPWFQGPGAFGGLVFASLGHAMEQAVGDPTRPLRNFQVQMCAPPGKGGQTIEAEVVRSGGRVSYTRALMRDGDSVLAIASGIFGGPMASALDEARLPYPEMTSVDETAVMPNLDFTPAFIDQFEVRVGQGGLPASNHHEALAAAWIKLREPPQTWDTNLTLGLLDVLWPAALAKSETFRRIGTISFSANLMHHPEDLNPEEPALALKESHITQEGYSDESNVLWSPSGKVLGVAHQLVAIIQ